MLYDRCNGLPEITVTDGAVTFRTFRYTVTTAVAVVRIAAGDFLRDYTILAADRSLVRFLCAIRGLCVHNGGDDGSGAE